MADWREEVRARLAPLRLSARRRDEIAEEIAGHLADRHAQLLAQGLSSSEADAAVRREFESPDALARRVHHAEHPGLTDLPVTRLQGQRVMRRLANDLRSGLRSLRHIRGATLMAVIAFALGIGITTAVFSVFYGVLLKPLPYPDADRMVVVFDVQPACKTCPASYPKFVDWRTRNTVFEEMAGINNFFGIVTGMGDAEQVVLARTTWTVPAVFKVPPAIGRWFTETEDSPGGDRVVVLGHQYWADRFGSDPGVLGRGLVLDGAAYRIIGVMPAGFQPATQLFKPLQLAVNPAQRGSHFLPVFARLKPGVTVHQAQESMVALGVVLAKEFGHNHGIDVQSYPERVLGTMRQPLRMLMGAVILVLLIACANIANLLLAAGTARRREFAVRAAIGATRWDLARQLVVEGVALAVVGGILGVALAEGAIRIFATLADQIVPRAATVSLDGAVLLFAAGLSIVTGVFCAMWPVMRLDVATLASAVREGDARAGTDAGSRRFGHGLVVAEIALAFSLLAGSGLLVKDLLLIESRSMGFQTEHVIAFDLALVGDRYQDPDAIRAFNTELFPRLQGIPGVEKAAATRNLPMYNIGWNSEVQVEGGNPWAATAAPLVEQAPITSDYFAALGMPVRLGRAFDDRDRKGAEPVAIVTKSTAEKFWPGQNPLGRRVTPGSAPNPKAVWLTVVGVVDDMRTFGLQSKPPFQMYFPADQWPSPTMSVILRVAGDDVSSPIPAVRRIVGEMDRSLAVSHVQTLDSLVSKSVSQPRLLSTLTAVFGGLAGLLAAVGVYGVMAYNVRRDRRQFGIQLALGADPARVRRVIVMRGIRLGGLGVAIGGLGAFWLTRFVAALLTDVKPTDPWIFGGTAAALLAVAVAACVRPAFQAGRTDPMVALRAE